jgi:hypothetical protein
MGSASAGKETRLDEARSKEVGTEHADVNVPT